MTETTHDLSTIVKAYDVRGRAGEDLTEEVARALGAAFSDQLDAAAIIVASACTAASCDFASLPALTPAMASPSCRQPALTCSILDEATDSLRFAGGSHRAERAPLLGRHRAA